MADKIRLGIIGANIHRGWAVRSHLPAVVASPEFRTHRRLHHAHGERRGVAREVRGPAGL